MLSANSALRLQADSKPARLSFQLEFYVNFVGSVSGDQELSATAAPPDSEAAPQPRPSLDSEVLINK